MKEINDMNFDPTFANLDSFEREHGISSFEFDCTLCNDTGYNYDDYGDKVACTCDSGTVWSRIDCEPDCNDWDDDSAFESVGWGDDDSYNYDDWN